MEAGTYVRVSHMRGVACVYLGPGKRWEPCMVIVEDEDGNEHEEPDAHGEGEWVPDDTIARVRMVGDDRVHLVDPDDCKPLAEGSFCLDCGQLGCSHGRYDDA